MSIGSLRSGPHIWVLIFSQSPLSISSFDPHGNLGALLRNSKQSDFRFTQFTLRATRRCNYVYPLTVAMRALEIHSRTTRIGASLCPSHFLRFATILYFLFYSFMSERGSNDRTGRGNNVKQIVFLIVKVADIIGARSERGTVQVDSSGR